MCFQEQTWKHEYQCNNDELCTLLAAHRILIVVWSNHCVGILLLKNIVSHKLWMHKNIKPVFCISHAWFRYTKSCTRLAMFACIVSFINILLFVSECLVHVLLFVEWAHVVLCSARQRLLWKKKRKDRGCAVLHVAAMCSFNVLSIDVYVCVCVCDCFMSSRNWTKMAWQQTSKTYWAHLHQRKEIWCDVI